MAVLRKWALLFAMIAVGAAAPIQAKGFESAGASGPSIEEPFPFPFPVPPPPPDPDPNGPGTEDAGARNDGN